MGLLAKRVRFQGVLANGAQAVTGVGFTPKAILFFCNHQSAALPSGNTGARTLIGCATAPTERWSLDAFANNGANGVADERQELKAISIINTTTGVVSFTAELASFDADGFTLTWAGTPVNAFFYEALCLGGDIQAQAGNMQAVTNTTEQTKSGVGFRPDVLIFAGMGDTTSLGGGVEIDWKLALGVACRDDLSQGAIATYQESQPAANAPSSWNRSGLALGNITNGTKDWSFAVNSFTSDGFKWQHDDAAPAAHRFMYLALRGTDGAAPLQAHVESHTQPGSTGTAAKSGLGFDPKALLGFSVQEATADNEATQVVRDMALVLGACGSDASDGTTWAHSSNTGTTTLDTDDYQDDAFLTFLNTSRTALARAQVSSLDTDGYTLDWTTADASGRKFFVLALGDGPAPTSRTKVKAAGAFGDGKPVSVKSGGTFTEKTQKVKVNGTFV